jgi:hypothetical protein
METTPGRPLGYWTRVVCTLRADGFFSQTDAEVSNTMCYMMFESNYDAYMTDGCIGRSVEPT